MTEQPRTAQAMADLGSQIVAALDADRRAVACFRFPDDEERRRFYWVPTDHGGLALHECEAPVQRLVLRLLAAGLSPSGFNTAVSIISLQHVLSRAEGWRVRADGRSARDPLEYQLSIFGEPAAGGSWAWRLGGHHLSLSYALIDGARLAPTPSFFGADPADAPLAGGNLLRPLAALEDLGRELVRSLDDHQLAAAVLASRAPHDLVAGNQELADHLWATPAAGLFRDGPDEVVSRLAEQHRQADEALGEGREALRFTLAPKGVAGSDLRSEQAEILRSLVLSYLDRLPDDVAAEQHETVLGRHGEDLHFAWAGSFEPGRPHYYRVQGDRVLLEYDNLNGNHIHSVWRDPAADFGDDPLRRHRSHAHR